MARESWWQAAARPDAAADRNRLVSIAVIVALAVAILAPLSGTTGFRLVDARAFDFLSTVATPPLPRDGPVIVAIDEPSFQEIGRQWPWPRDLHARLVEALRKAGAKTIGLDIIFSEPSSPEADAALAAALGPDVVLAGDDAVIVTEHADQRVRVEPLPDFTAAGAATGISSVVLDRDATLRAIPAYPDGFARILLERSGISPGAARSGLLMQAFGPSRTYPTVSYYQALDPDAFLPAGTFAGKTVIVGLSMQSAPTVEAKGADAYATSWTVRSGTLVPGAEIQATIFDNLRRPFAIESARPLVALGALILAALAAGRTVRRGTGRATALWTLAGVLAIVAASFVLLRLGRVYLAPVAPALAFVAVAAAQGARDYAAERRLRKGITRAFSQYLSPVLVERLASDPSLLRLGGERRTISVLFCDVRGFTTIAEGMKDDPERLTSLVNRLLSPLSSVVLDAGGTIDKYIGDCIMAFWNAPLDDPRHAINAVEAALRMLAALETLNAELAQEALRDGTPGIAFRVGIGINTGDCVVGNMGSDMRFDYSALGDTVNLASRLEGETKRFGVPILMGPETARRIEGLHDLAELDRIQVKGKDEVIAVWTLARFRHGVMQETPPGG